MFFYKYFKNKTIGKNGHLFFIFIYQEIYIANIYYYWLRLYPFCPSLNYLCKNSRSMGNTAI